MAAKIWIVAGEGEGQGHRSEYAGAKTVRALKAAMAVEACGGDRWVRCEVETDERHPERCTPEDAISMLGRVAAGDGERVQFRTSKSIRARLLERAGRAQLTERQAWERAAQEWADRG